MNPLEEESEEAIQRRLEQELAQYEYNPDDDDEFEKSTVFSVAESVDFALLKEGRMEEYYEQKARVNNAYDGFLNNNDMFKEFQN